MKSMPMHCPSCGHNLLVKRLTCQQCNTEVEGLYEFPILALLGRDDQEFVLQFMKASGSLKEMSKLLKLSYPTVRNRLDEIIENIKRIQEQQEEANG